MEQFLATSATISNDEIILVLMNNTLPCYKMFISFLKNLVLKFLYKKKLDEKSLHPTSNNT